MIDSTPSAAPMPAQPEATVTNPEAPFPPAGPLPYGVAPAVTDRVSNPDFLPVDDAFALELRAESIEQLSGGDVLRRGESERIEAGRSETNADLVAGRDRVRVHGTLLEHTGHGLAEQAAHLHTTVEGRLDVHAASEDTVLLAGHMSDLWDGGTAIVAAMSDDTVAGGGIRVTAPLDLWVHGLMGVEERIGTCTADAVLMELSGTHYEREYGPGVHAAGLAVYTGSLYQSSSSTFRPLMRVSSGVRNLIAGGGGGDGGGDGSGASAPAASPPPVPAQTGAAAAAVTGTLAAGRRAAEAPASALDTADGLTGARCVPLEELVNSADVRGIEEMGEAGAVMRAEDLPELTRSSGTAEQLGALQETLRMDGAEAWSEVAGGLRASEFEGAVSVHPASGAGRALDIEPPSAVYGENAPIVRSHPDVPWGQGSEMTLGLLGGADRPPQSAVPESDFPAAHQKLRELRSYYNRIHESAISYEFERAINRVTHSVSHRFDSFRGQTMHPLARAYGITVADQAYSGLQDMARQADNDRDFMRAGEIREALNEIDRHTAEELLALTTKYRMVEPQPPASLSGTTTADQAYHAIEDMFRRAAESGDSERAYHTRQALELIDQVASRELDRLTTKNGALAQPITVESPVAVPSATVPLTGRLDIPGSPHPIALDVTPAFVEPAGGLVHATGVPGPPPASGLPEPSLAEAAGTDAGDLGRWWLDQPASAPGTTAVHPVAAEAIVTPSLGETSSFWLQPVDPVPVPGSVPFDSGLLHAGETVQPPPLTTAPSSTAPGALYHVPSWVEDDFAVERALIAGNLPPGFDASPLIVEAGTFAEFGLAEELAAGRLPTHTIDALIEGHRATDEANGNLLIIEYLISLKESIERALRDEYPQRADPRWLEWVREIPRPGGELAAPSAASATGLPEIDRLLEAIEGISHPAPPQPPSAPGRIEVGTGAPPPAADLGRIRPLGMSGEPHPAAFDPWSAPPGPSSQARHTETIPTPVLSTGAPPGWQGAETPGFGRLATDSVELPFSQREAIVHRFRFDDAVLDAELTLRTGGDEALGWSATRWRGVLDDLLRLNDIARLDPEAAAAMADIDWSALETLMRILDAPPPSP